MQDQVSSPVYSDASNINTKAPNVFASPHFRQRINSTRLSFKEFQKKEINNPNNPPNFPVDENHVDSPVTLFANLFSKKSESESKDELPSPPNFISKESIVETLNQENFLNGEEVNHPDQGPSIHIKLNNTFSQVPSIPGNSEETSDQESCVDYDLFDSTSSQSLAPTSPIDDKFSVHNSKYETSEASSALLNNDNFRIDDNETLIEDVANTKENDKKSKLFNKPLPKDHQNSYSNNNFSITKNNSGKSVPSPGNKPSNNVRFTTNFNKDKNIFPTTEHNNFEIKEHSNDNNELNLIIGAVQKWKEEVDRRDYLIEELRGQVLTLRDTLEHKEHSLSHYRERMFLVDSMVKRQHNYTERSRERIDNIKLKYSFFRNLLCNMGKNIGEMCNQKERIESEVELMRSEFSKLATKHKSTLDSQISISQTQQTQLKQITELNAQLNNITTQLHKDIQEINSKASRFSPELDVIRLKLEHLFNSRENEKSTHAEEFQKLQLEFKHAGEDNLNLVKSNKENIEKILSLTVNIEREIESTQSEYTRLNSIIKEKDERVTQLKTAEKERDVLKLELNQAKDLAKKDIHSLRQEMEILRAQHATDLKCVESKFREDCYKSQNDFHKERCHLEDEWRKERVRLESEYREERAHRSSLESEYRNEKSERFRIETELKSSEQKIKEISKASDIDNLRIVQLESKLNEIGRRQTDRSTVAVGTADIMGLDLQIEHKKIISKLNQENIDSKRNIEELTSELEVWKSKSSSLESQLVSLNLKYTELQNKHRESLTEISNYYQNKEAVDQALNRSTNNYQDTAERTILEYKNEIREAGTKLVSSTKETKEIQALKSKSKLSEMEDRNKSLQYQSVESREFVTPKLPPSEAKESILNKEYNSEILKNEQHSHKLLTLTEIDAMIIESSGLANLRETEQNSQNATIQQGHNNNARDIDDWLSPGTNLRSKRRKRDSSEGVDNSELIEQLSARSTTISMNSGEKEESKLGARFRFRGRSKVRRRFTIGGTNGKE